MARRMRLALAPVLITLLATAAWAFVPGADGPVTSQEALEGRNATLLCDTSAHEPGDELMLLVWYKNNAPIYSYDARIHSEWSNESFNFNNRLAIDITKDPTELTIINLTEEDQGLFHCRVDFQLTQTRNLGVNLTIVVLPSAPFFLDEVGNKVETKIGPYHDGDNLVLSCLVIGGRPQPAISWYSGDTLVDESYGPSDIPNVWENVLYLPLNRDHNAPLTCKASNTAKAPPVTSSLDIELYLPANKVTIVLPKQLDGSYDPPAGKVTVVKCEAEGSNPQPDLSWWLDHRQLTQHTNHSYLNATDKTVSYIELKPSVGDNGAALSCVATNVAMAPSRGSRTQTVNLNITYSPIVEVSQVGHSKVGEVLELDPLHLQCNVKANPAVFRISWYFNNYVIYPGGMWGNQTSLASLLVEEAARSHSGKYSCSAANNVGETRAQPISIIVLYPPECIDQGIKLTEETIICNVRALPAPDIFFWHIQPKGEEPQQLTTGSPLLPLSQISGQLFEVVNVVCEAGNGVASQYRSCQMNLNLEHLRPPQPTQCDLVYELDEFHVRCIPVINATHYEVSIWKMSITNTSLVLQRRGVMLGWGTDLPGLPQALPHGSNQSWLVRGALGQLGPGDEAGAMACNRYGCSGAMILKPTENLLRAAAPPWWHFFIEKDFGISIGAVVLVAAFIVSTSLAVRLARRPSSKTPAPIVQVLQLDDLTREYIDNALVKHHASCSVRSCSSGYSGGSQDLELAAPPPVDRQRKPIYYWDPGPPPDVTLTLHRESAV